MSNYLGTIASAASLMMAPSSDLRLTLPLIDSVSRSQKLYSRISPRNKPFAKPSRKAAAIPEQQFEQKVQEDRERITAPVPKTVTEEPKPKKVVDVRGAVDQCVDAVKATIKNAVAQMRRGQAKPERFEQLFAALQEVIDDLRNKTLPPKSVEESAEERRAVNAKLASEAITKEAEAAPAQ
jgi:hypothetical protein